MVRCYFNDSSFFYPSCFSPLDSHTNIGYGDILRALTIDCKTSITRATKTDKIFRPFLERFCLIMFFSREPRLYKRVCPSVRPSVRPSVGPSRVFFGSPKMLEIELGAAKGVSER